jgi:hypothetical protein
MASASVNVLLGLWFCHACQASGTVDGKSTPSHGAIASMIKPEETARVYPDAYLELFAQPGYWLSRFPDWLCHAMGLGEDPFTGDATFPVHTSGGLLSGVGRRKANGQPKYLYPHTWSAASSLFGMWGTTVAHDVIVLVEGAADATAMWQVGMPALAVYGSGLHLPQMELLARYCPKLVLLGFDMDSAGRCPRSPEHPSGGGVQRAQAMIGQRFPVAVVNWEKNDPADCDEYQRLIAVMRAVSASGYVGTGPTAWSDQAMETSVSTMKSDFASFKEEMA